MVNLEYDNRSTLSTGSQLSQLPSIFHNRTTKLIINTKSSTTNRFLRLHTFLPWIRDADHTLTALDCCISSTWSAITILRPEKSQYFIQEGFWSGPVINHLPDFWACYRYRKATGQILWAPMMARPTKNKLLRQDTETYHIQIPACASWSSDYHNQ